MNQHWKPSWKKGHQGAQVMRIAADQDDIGQMRMLEDLVLRREKPLFQAEPVLALALYSVQWIVDQSTPFMPKTQKGVP